MPEQDNDNSLKADIPQEAIDAALRAVEGNRPGESAGEGRAEQGGSDEVRQLKAMLEDSTARAAQTAERLKETHERYLRVAADFENYKKRAAKEREDTIKFANERMLKDLLLVVDNLERASSAGGDAATLQNGVKLVLKQFMDTLSRFGVRAFSAVGEQFDPTKHEALMQMESNDVPSNVVISEMAKGYQLNDRLIRPAQVVVSKGPPAAQASAAEGAGEAPQEGQRQGETLH